MVSHLLQSIPPEVVYLIVGLIIMVESLGIPVPGEIALVTAAVLATQHKAGLSPAWIAACSSAGAIIGDSIGFLIGRRFGKPLFGRLGRRFPRHFGPGHVALAERVFTRYGVWAVFFGRFIALLRILAGPLAGSLRMPYYKFLAANVLGGREVDVPVVLARAGRGGPGRPGHHAADPAEDRDARAPSGGGGGSGSRGQGGFVCGFGCYHARNRRQRGVIDRRQARGRGGWRWLGG